MVSSLIILCSFSVDTRSCSLGISFSSVPLSYSMLSYLFLDSWLSVFLTAMNLSSIYWSNLFSISFLAIFSWWNLSSMDFLSYSTCWSYISCSYSLAYLSVSMYFKHSVTLSLKTLNFSRFCCCQVERVWSVWPICRSKWNSFPYLSFSISTYMSFNLERIRSTRL